MRILREPVTVAQHRDTNNSTDRNINNSTTGPKKYILHEFTIKGINILLVYGIYYNLSFAA